MPSSHLQREPPSLNLHLNLNSSDQPAKQEEQGERDSTNPPPNTPPVPTRPAAQTAAVVAATATPRLPSKGLCELFAKLLRPEEQQRYLLLCLKLLRRATEARWPVSSSSSSSSAAAAAASSDAHQLRQTMAAQLAHTEQMLEVLKHVLQATDARHIPSLNDAAENTTTTKRAPQSPGGGGGEGQAAQPRRRRKRAQPRRAASSPRGSHTMDLTESDSDDGDAAAHPEKTNGSMSLQRQVQDIEAEVDEASGEWCDGSFHQELVELVLAEMGGWVPAARRSSLSTATPVPPRLRFLSFLMALWAKLRQDDNTDDAELLGVQRVERLWALLLVKDVAGESSVSLLDWLRQVTAHMSVSTRAHVFSKLLCPLLLASGSEGRADQDTTMTGPPPPPPPLPNVTANALRCFTHFFVSCNATLGALEADVRRSPSAERRPPVRRVIQLEALQGLDALWSFVLCCPEEVVANTAIQFLHLLYRSSDSPPNNNNNNNINRRSPDCSDDEDHLTPDAPPVRSGALQLSDLVFQMLRGMAGDHTAASSAAVPGMGVVGAQQPGVAAVAQDSDDMRRRRCHRALLVLQYLLQVDFTRQLAAHRDGGVGRTFQLPVLPGAGHPNLPPLPLRTFKRIRRL